MKLDNALWVYHTSYKIPIGMSPYQLVFDKACHFPFELEHHAQWVVKCLNIDLKDVGDKCWLQLNEFNEFRWDAMSLHAYTKEQIKELYNRIILPKEFHHGQ